jgi:hypothetical protein
VLLGPQAGAFADAQEAAEGGVGQIAHDSGFWGGSFEAFSDAPARDADWNCELGLRDGVRTAAALWLVLKCLPALGGCAVAAARVGPRVQFEVRDDGTWCDLDSLSANLPPSADASLLDKCSEGLQGCDSCGGVVSAELGVQVMVFVPLEPGTPMAFPFLVRRRHESMLCGCPCSSEETDELSLVLRRNSCQEVFWSKGN